MSASSHSVFNSSPGLALAMVSCGRDFIVVLYLLGIALAFLSAFSTACCFCFGTWAAFACTTLYIWAFSAQGRSQVVLACNASQTLFQYLHALSSACTHCLASSCCTAEMGEDCGSWFSWSSALILHRLFWHCTHCWGLHWTIPSRSEHMPQKNSVMHISNMLITSSFLFRMHICTMTLKNVVWHPQHRYHSNNVTEQYLWPS